MFTTDQLQSMSAEEIMEQALEKILKVVRLQEDDNRGSGRTNPREAAVLAGAIASTTLEFVRVKRILPTPVTNETICEITDLVPGFKFEFPVSIKICQVETGVFIGECALFNLFTAPTSSPEEALENIKILLVDDYNAFLQNYPNNLTKCALNTLRLYCALFCKNIIHVNQ